MKALILAAGLGTRLREYTQTKPKALVEVNGKAMLELAIEYLITYGIKEIFVNIHHFGDQIIDFLESKNFFNCRIRISDERDRLLNTGGAIKKVLKDLREGENLLVYNVDILTHFNLNELIDFHQKNKNLVSLLVKHRETSRYLCFNQNMQLKAWTNIRTDEVLPEKYLGQINKYEKLAFSGIHIVNQKALKFLPKKYVFDILPEYIKWSETEKITGFKSREELWIDMGKPAKLKEAQEILKNNSHITFIDTIVETLLKNIPYSEIPFSAIITPNKRAKRFIKKRIIQKNPSGGFLPEIISIEEFVFKLVPLKKLDEIELFFKLYPIVENCLDNETTFNDFLNYASTLLKDFDDLDMNLTDGQKVFSYLSDAKAIELWNPEGTALSSSQRSYLDFYNHLATIYKLFKAELLSKSESYMGMAFRYLAENEKLLDNKLGFKHIFIAGFNAMTNSEEQIIKTLHQKHGAQLIWDVDAYYYHDLQKEAGAYLRKYNRWTSSVKEQLNHNFLNKPKQINTIGCPGTIAQARMAAEILKKNYDENRNFINRTTIVPADENILLALLNSFPESILGHTNITMGFPLRFSNSYKLLNCIIQLHSNAYRLNKIDSEQARFLSEDFMQLIKNDLIKIYSANLSKMNIAERFISQQSLIDLLELKGKVKLAYLFMSIYEDAADLNLLLIHFFKELKVDIREHENIKQLEQELDAIIKIVDLLENFEKMFNEHKIEITVKSYHILVHKLLDQKKQSFEGRTEDGLQIMGLLETRLLDFENVIILSANEDILPSSPFSPTFIPYDVKSAFELPGLTEKTAIYAYHFYRLLQRAKRIDILYSTSGKKLGGSDKSRFLRQLDYELKDYNSEHILNQRLLSFASPKTENHSISIEKEEQLIEKIKQLTVSGLSLSAINTYILCQLKFYFGYLAEITEPESEKDIIDDRVFGNIIHDFLEKEYKKIYLNNWNVKSLNTLKNAIPEKLPFYFKKNGISSNIQDGSLYLDYKNIIFYLKKFIDNEIEVLSKNTADFKIIGIEEKLHRLIKIGKRHDVKIKGRIDRIDVLNGFTRILDYKTGKVDTQDLNFRDDSFQDLFTKPKKAKTLQLFLYKWLYGTLNNPQIKTGIVSLQNIHNPYLILENSTFNNEDFEEALHGLVEEILNPEINFMQTEDFKVCEICIYKNICRR